MATTSVEGRPTASYAPFVHHCNCFYVYTSALSRHTKDLKETPRASILLIEDEGTSTNLFARKRITFTCNVFSVPRDDEEWQEVMELFGKKFGEIFALIRPLGDFTLFRLSPQEAIYVEGFGRAFQMSPDLRNPVRIKGTGPGASPLEAHAKK